jgi:hypothetical protein
MITPDMIDSDKAAVASAQAALDAANAQLAKDEAALAVAQPHLSILDEIAAYVTHLSAEVQAEFTALITKAKSLF